MVLVIEVEGKEALMFLMKYSGPINYSLILRLLAPFEQQIQRMEFKMSSVRDKTI